MGTTKKTTKAKKSAVVVSVDAHLRVKEALKNSIDVSTKAAIKLLASRRECIALKEKVKEHEDVESKFRELHDELTELIKERKELADAEIERLNNVILEIKGDMNTSLSFNKMLMKRIKCFT
tara:strand:+ start:176 stop:541 length:366 start_codon:yes stop_codon:yes gene_type:complete